MRQEVKVYMSHTDAETLRHAARCVGVSLSSYMKATALIAASRVAYHQAVAQEKGVGKVSLDGVLLGQVELPIGDPDASDNS